MKYCALCCTARDEDPFIKEWLAYHALLGFEHFILYDDRSATPLTELLGVWAPPERVTVIRRTEQQDQVATYTHCLERYGSGFRWIAFLDVDEFLRLGPVCKETEKSSPLPDVRGFLGNYEPYAAVGLNWRTFSSSGHEMRPADPVIAAYTRCFGDDTHIKSIVQPSLTSGCAGAHSFYPKQGEHAVNAARFPIPPGFPLTIAETDVAAIHHYYYKSRECFSVKTRRGNPCNIERRMEDFERHLGEPDEPDVTLLPYADAVAEAVAGERMPEAEQLWYRPGEDHPDGGLGQARAFLADAAQGLNTEQALRRALLHLAYVSLYNHADNMPDPQISMAVWTMRAEAALQTGQFDLAQFCLERAFSLGASREAHALLARLLLRKGRRQEAQQALTIIKATGGEER